MRRLAHVALSVLLGAGLLAAAPPSIAAPAAPAEPQAETAAGFHALTPVRVLDTRSGAPVGPQQSIPLDLSTKVPATATAVVLNVTGTQPNANTFVTVYPAGAPRPVASNLNLVAGETRPNLVTVALGTGRQLSLFNNSGTVHLLADLAGYYAPDAAGKFTALSPQRLMDSRHALPFAAGESRTLDLSYSVPSSATAVVLTLTGTAATQNTYVTAWPTGKTRPVVSNLNLTPGATAPNLVTVELGADRKVDLFNNTGNTHLIADLAGFYTADYGALFTAITPKRVLDTRNGTGGITGPLNAGGQQELVLGATLPWSTTGVVLNLTGTEPTQNTFITAWPRLDPRPGTSNLNLAPGQTSPSLAAVAVGTLASVSLYNNSGTVHLIADMAGYFSLPPVSCGSKCVYAWGSNQYGQLGTGAYTPASASPNPVYGLSGVKAVAGGSAGYALLEDGTVWAWGPNFTGELGNGWSGGKSIVPVPVIGLTEVTKIDKTIALRSDGTVWTWDNIAHSVPTPKAGLTDIIDVAAAFGTGYALRADGTVWSWGSNSFGSLGNGSTEYSVTPVQVSGLTDVKQIAGGRHAGYAIKQDGTLWSWGDNRQGQLGHGTVGGDGCYTYPSTGEHCISAVPAQVVGLAGVTAIAADSAHGFAVLGDGTGWSWGNNYQGGLGTGSDCECRTGTPAKISGLSNAKSVAAAENGGYALDGEGRVWAWGDNSQGQLGTTDVANPGSYSKIALRLRDPIGVTAIAATYRGALALVP